MPSAPDQQTDQQMDPSMDLSINLQAETAHTIHHTILDHISETIVNTQAAMKTTKTDEVSTGTTIETEGTNRTHNMIRQIMAFRTGMTIIKIETGLKTEDDQPNTNTTENNPEHR